jgi:hypothetical protein
MDDALVDRFVGCLQRSAPDTAYRLHVERESTGETLCRSMARNRGITALLPHCRVIVCVDLDCLIPPGLVEATLETVADGRAVWCLCRNVEVDRVGNPIDFDQLWFLPKRTAGFGSWVGMTAADWIRIGGWDERLTQWGGEDELVKERRAAMNIETRLLDFPLLHVNHPARDGDPGWRLSGNMKNLEIGRQPAPRNWLTARLPVDPYHNHFSLFVTGSCNRACPQCSQRGLMRADPTYQMGLEEVEAFIIATQASGYQKYRSLIITGGEPLLWKHIEPALEMLWEAGLAEQINVFSNGQAHQRVTRHVMDHITTLRLSRYADNAESISVLQAAYGAKIRVVDQLSHFDLPTALLPESVLPAKCVCEGWALYNGRVYGCPNLLAVSREQGVELTEESVCPLRVGYRELLARFPRTTHPLCRACIGNEKVRNYAS